MSTDVLRFPVVLPPREGTLSKRFAAVARRAYEAVLDSRMRKANAEIARHNHVHLDAAIEEAELGGKHLGALPFVR